MTTLPSRVLNSTLLLRPKMGRLEPKKCIFYFTNELLIGLKGTILIFGFLPILYSIKNSFWFNNVLFKKKK